MLGSILVAGDSALNKIEKVPALWEGRFGVGGGENEGEFCFVHVKISSRFNWSISSKMFGYVDTALTSGTLLLFLHNFSFTNSALSMLLFFPELEGSAPSWW